LVQEVQSVELIASGEQLIHDQRERGASQRRVLSPRFSATHKKFEERHAAH
jgi:hypothetical protein